MPIRRSAYRIDQTFTMKSWRGRVGARDDDVNGMPYRSPSATFSPALTSRQAARDAIMSHGAMIARARDAVTPQSDVYRTCAAEDSPRRWLLVAPDAWRGTIIWARDSLPRADEIFSAISMMPSAAFGDAAIALIIFPKALSLIEARLCRRRRR